MYKWKGIWEVYVLGTQEMIKDMSKFAFINYKTMIDAEYCDRIKDIEDRILRRNRVPAPSLYLLHISNLH